MPNQRSKVYYVNDVGNDFTFYLQYKGNENLLLKESISQTKSEKKEKDFENSKKLDVIVLSNNKPYLSAKHIEKNGEKFVKILSPHTLKQRDPLRKLETLFNTFSARLKSNIITDLDKCLKEKNKEKLEQILTNLANALNKLLSKKYLHKKISVKPITLESDEEESIKKLGFTEEEINIYRNRKLFDKHFKDLIKPLQIKGRSLINLSYEGEFLSTSFRKQSDVGYEPKQAKGSFLLGIADYCDVLSEVIFNLEKGKKLEKKVGLLVITGATNSAKSEIARGLIYRYLESIDKKERRHHLVTFEDPIEKLYAKKPNEPPQKENCSIPMPATLENKIDYTPRELEKDVGSLKQAFLDALRQTPSVFFVGETRKKEDWEEIVSFAGTGHLVITTAHAGSLTEAVHKIFSALKIETPAARSELAGRLLGVVHLRPSVHNDNIKIPAVWRQTGVGKNTLVAEGLSSILPHNPDLADTDKGCLGRAWFIKRFEPKLKDKNEDIEALKKEAMKWDLEGV